MRGQCVMKMVLRLLGFVFVAFGTLFALQGSGIVMWPSSSFMLEQRVWVMYGLVIVLLGIGMILFARRR